jgi:release factor glutamine methyltransferase
MGVVGDDRVLRRGRMPRPSLRRRLPPVTCVTFHFVDEGTDQAGGRDLRAVRDETVGRLAAAGVPDPDVDAELLIGHVLGLSRGGVQARLVVGGALGRADAATLESLVRRRERREPLQHLTGRAAFRSLDLAVGPGVFVPRPETEQVAQLAIDALRATAEPEPIAIDLGSGSGAIALAMATEVPHARVWAVENSPAAFPWTRRNVEEVGAPNLELVFGDLATALAELDGRAAVVVSNPPYVPAGELPRDPEVRLHDPEAALYGGADGLDVVRVLSIRAAELLHPGGLLVIEHAETQSAPIAAILGADGWRAIAHHRDLTSRDRATTAVR